MNTWSIKVPCKTVLPGLTVRDSDGFGGGSDSDGFGRIPGPQIWNAATQIITDFLEVSLVWANRDLSSRPTQAKWISGSGQHFEWIRGGAGAGSDRRVGLICAGKLTPDINPKRNSNP